MLRRGVGLASQFGATRAFASSSTARQDLATTTWGSSGILSTLGFTNASVSAVPMTHPFPGTVEPHRTLPPKQPYKTQLTTLSNGFRVASVDSHGTTAAIGLAVASGSQNESQAVTGASHFLEYMAYRGTKNRTHFRLVQELYGCGAMTAVNATREQMYYSIECLKSDLPRAMELICDVAINPKFSPWDVDEVRAMLKFDLDQLKKDPHPLIYELLEGAVYFGGLGNPLLNTPISVDRLTAEKLAHFHSENFKPNRMVLSVVGMDHESVLGIAEPMAGTLPKAEPYTPPLSTYIGGEIKKPDDNQMCHVVLAFDVEGGWRDVKSACEMTVLYILMGGGGSFSSGGPGKGMHSRLYLNVLTKYSWVHNFTAINQAFDGRCLTGIYGAVPPEWASKLVDIMTEELISLSRNITDVELNRAKNSAIGQVLMNIENLSTEAEDMARQILTYGHRKDLKVYMDGLKNVTKDDLKKRVSNMLKSPVSMASMGNVSHMPIYAEVARRFG